jgi:hypothetical protein
MATFAEMQSQVSQRLLDPNGIAISPANVAASINDSIRYWKFRRFWFNEVMDFVTVTQNDGTIPMTGDILVPATDYDGFFIEYSSMRYPLRKATQQEYDGWYLTNGYGLPYLYARVGQDFEMYPLPDRNYTLGRHYLKEYAPLVADADTNDFTDYADRLIVLWSLADLMAELRQDDKMETYYRARADAEYKNLQVMTDKSNGTGRLTLSSTLY